MLAFLVDKLGADKVMMGTDHPRGEAEDDPVGFVDGTRRLAAANKRRIMGDHAAALFGLA